MRQIVIFLLLTIYCIGSMAQSTSTVIRFSQSLRHGNGGATLILGSDKNAIEILSENSSGYPIYVKSLKVKKEKINYISGYIAKKCISNYSFKNGDGFQVIIEIVNGKHTIKCGLVNTQLVEGYFRKLIEHLKKLPPGNEREKVIREIQQIIDYAALPEYRG